MKFAIILWMLPLWIVAQNNLNRVAVELAAGAEVGWWVYNKGTTNPDVNNNLGWDRTHLDLLSVYEINAMYSVNKWKIGGGANFTQLYNSKMVGSNDTGFFNDEYNIANGTVKFYKFYFLTEYEVVKYKRYSLNPQLKAGFFKINTTHPEKDNFGVKMLYEVGFNNQVMLFNRWNFTITPRYAVLLIKPKEPNATNEKHNVYSLGVNVGLRYWLR